MGVGSRESGNAESTEIFETCFFVFFSRGCYVGLLLAALLLRCTSCCLGVRRNRKKIKSAARIRYLIVKSKYGYYAISVGYDFIGTEVLVPQV